MEMEVSRIIIGGFFILVGAALFLGAIRVRLQMEKEVKDGVTFYWNSILPYWNESDFNERGNSLRKKYNKIYYALIIYSLALIIFMKSSG
jgi:hypothetical protein